MHSVFRPNFLRSASEHSCVLAVLYWLLLHSVHDVQTRVKVSRTGSIFDT